MNTKAICFVGPALALIVATLWNVQVVAEKKGRPLFARENADLPRHSLVEPPTIASSMAICESTGFEAVEGPCGWELGWICGSTFTACSGPPIAGSCTGNPITDVDCCITNPNPLNGWYLSGTSQHCNEPTIESVNPSTAQQHMRIGHDPTGGNPPGCTGFSSACRVNVFTPVGVSGVQPIGSPLTISMDVAMGPPFGTPPFGSSMVWLGVYDPVGINIVWYFHYYGVFFVYNHALNAYSGVASMFGDGVYQTFRAEMNPCTDEIDYYVDNVLSLSTPVADGESRLSRGIFTSNNAGSHHDVDNYYVIRHPECPCVCGNNDICGVFEECDVTDDDNCPGACGQDCICIRPCSDCSNPCQVGNGQSGPYLTDGGLYTYTADSPFTSIDTCGSDYDTVLFWNLSNNCTEYELVNDECNEMTDALGQNAGDPSAACYAAGQFPFDSCLCAATTPGEAYSFAITEYGETLPALGETHMINIRKKTACGAPIMGGACCRGLTGMCEDGVSANECDGEFDAYYAGKLCSSPSLPACEAIIGACCNTAPGASGACSDTLHGACSFDWTPNTNCSTLQPPCTEITGACCNRLLGNCSQTIQGNCTCLDCVWTQDTDCANIPCFSIQGPCCVRGEQMADCTQTNSAQCDALGGEWTRDTDCANVSCDPLFDPVPTVSQWGLVALGLALLIGAKLMRGRHFDPSPSGEGGSA